jgi:hypothetical protein
MSGERRRHQIRDAVLDLQEVSIHGVQLESVTPNDVCTPGPEMRWGNRGRRSIHAGRHELLS